MPKSFMGCLYNGYKERELGNHKDALEYFEMALQFQAVSPVAAYEVARYYEEGVIVPQDMENAFGLYSQAADGCVEMAQYKLASWYEQGTHVEKNTELACSWRDRADAQAKKSEQPIPTIAESIRQKVEEVKGQS